MTQASTGVLDPTWPAGRALRLTLILVVFPLVLAYGMPLLESTQALYAGTRGGWFGFWLPAIALEWITLVAVVATFSHGRRALASLGHPTTLDSRHRLTLVALAAGSVALAVLGAGSDQEFLREVPDGARMFFPPPDVAARLFWIVVSFTAAYCEEILWRAVAITELRAVGLPVWAAVVVASFCFAFFHGGLAQGLPLLGYRFALAVGLSVLYLRAGGLWAVMLIHYVMDASALAAI